MNNGKDIYNLLLVTAYTGGFDSKYFNQLNLINDDELFGISMKLLLEIQELIEAGYTINDIREMIIKIDFKEKGYDLLLWQEELLKKDALYILDVRYEIWINNKKIKRKKEKITCENE